MTIKEDVHKYPGSGKYWKAHLIQHGYDYTTEIIKECQAKEELRYWGIYYSILWNIVTACDNNGKKLWANLKPETGDGAPPGNDHHMKDATIHAKAVNTRKQNGSYIRTKESIDKSLETRISKYRTLNTCTAAGIEKGLETKRKNGTTGNNLSAESISKAIATKHLNGTLNSNTPESIDKCRNTKKLNNSLPSSPAVISKALETRRQNGTLNTSTPESIIKRKETRRIRIQAGTDGVAMKVVCPHCNKEGGRSIMKRWHFDNCKHLTS